MKGRTNAGSDYQGITLPGAGQRRPSKRLWVALFPALLAGMFALVFGGLLLWLEHWRSRRDRSDLLFHARSGAEGVARRLHEHRRYLGWLAQHAGAGRVQDKTLRTVASQYVREQPGLRSVRWVDANETIQWAVPAETFGGMAGLAIRLPEPRHAYHEAARGRRAVYTGPFGPGGGGNVFEVYVPSYRGETFLGALNASYRCRDVLDWAVPQELAEEFRISVVDRWGGVLAAPQAGSPPPGLESESVPLDPPGHGVALCLHRLGQPFWTWPTVLLAALSVGLAGGMTWAMWTLRRDLRRRERAVELVESSLRERDLFLKEVHHRVKNNLQLVTSLLVLQGQAVEDPNVRRALQECQSRVRTMTLIHRELYSSSSLASIRMREYVENIVNHLLLAYGKPTQAVDVRVRADDVSLGAEEAIPCGLILNELVSNALKYAFPEGGRGELRVAFRREGEQCFAVTVRDNGVGLPAEMDLDHPPSLGLQLVQMLTEQLQGTLEVDRQRGTCFRITFRPREQPPAPS